jgi:hypothetical protein
MNKETSELNNIIDKNDLTDIRRIFHPIVTEYIFFSENHGTLAQIDYMLGHIENLTSTKKSK